MRLRKVNSGDRGGDSRPDWREVGEGKVVTAVPDVSARRAVTASALRAGRVRLTRGAQVPAREAGARGKFLVGTR